MNFESECLLNTYKLLPEIENIKGTKTSSQMTQDEIFKYKNLLHSLLESIKLLCQNDLFSIAFRNNQIVCDITLKSFEHLIKSSGKFNVRKTSTSLLVNLLTLTVKDEKHAQNDWLTGLIKEFFISTQVKLAHLFFDEAKLENNDSFVFEILDLINFIFEIVPFKNLLLYDFITICLVYLIQYYPNDVNKTITIMKRILSKISIECLVEAIGPSTHAIKFFGIISTFKDIVCLLMSNHEMELVQSKQKVISELHLAIDLARNYFNDDVGIFFADVYDKFLSLFNEKIDNFSCMDLTMVNYYSDLAIVVANDRFDSILINQRHDSLLELMVKVISKWPQFDLNNERDYKLIKMAYQVINIIIDSGKNEAKFQFFYDNYWHLIKNHWIEIAKTDKGHVALGLINTFLNSYDSNLYDLVFLFVDVLHENLTCMSARSVLVRHDLQLALRKIAIITVKKEHMEKFNQKLSSIFELYFNIGKNMNFSKWNSSFSSFNESFVMQKYDFIMNHENLRKLYFEMVASKIKLDEINKIEKKSDFDGDLLAFDFSYFLYRFIKIYQNEFCDENKQHFVQVLEYLVTLSTSRQVRLDCEKAIKLLVNQ